MWGAVAPERSGMAKHSDKRPTVQEYIDLAEAFVEARDISGYERLLERYRVPEEVKKQLVDRLKRVVANELRSKERL